MPSLSPCFFENRIIVDANNFTITLSELSSKVQVFETLQRIQFNKFQKRQIVKFLIEEKIMYQIAQRYSFITSQHQIDLCFKLLLDYHLFQTSKHLFLLSKIYQAQIKNHIKLQILIRQITKKFFLKNFILYPSTFLNQSNINNKTIFFLANNLDKLLELLRAKQNIFNILLFYKNIISSTDNIFQDNIIFKFFIIKKDKGIILHQIIGIIRGRAFALHITSAKHSF